MHIKRYNLTIVTLLYLIPTSTIAMNPGHSANSNTTRPLAHTPPTLDQIKNNNEDITSTEFGYMQAYKHTDNSTTVFTVINQSKGQKLSETHCTDTGMQQIRRPEKEAIAICAHIESLYNQQQFAKSLAQQAARQAAQE